MKFKSTRGGVSGYSYEDAICSGYAPDGGLFIPEELPQLTRSDISRLASLPNFQEVAIEVLRLFISEEEVPLHELRKLVYNSFKGFDNPNGMSLF